MRRWTPTHVPPPRATCVPSWSPTSVLPARDEQLATAERFLTRTLAGITR